ncbi:TPA: hypothetical protein ACH3X1_007503 [Trebouxia sp. C0004]
MPDPFPCPRRGRLPVRNMTGQSLQIYVPSLAGMLGPASSAGEDDVSGWQNLSLEHDLLLQVFGKLSSSQLVKLSSVSSGWRRATTTLCDLWLRLDISPVQAKSASFAAWVEARGQSVKQLSIVPQGDWGLPQSCDRQFLASMQHLEVFIDGTQISMESLQQMQPSLQEIQAVCEVNNLVVDADGCGTLNLAHLTGLRKMDLCIDTQPSANMMNVEVQLAQEARLEMLKLVSMSDTASLSLCPGRFQHLKSLYISVIISQKQMEDIMVIVTLMELTIGVDTDEQLLREPADGHDNVNISHIGNLTNLRQLDLRLLSCYLRNGHLLQRLPELQQLSFSMTDQVAVLFRPEDGSSYELPCLLNKLQHVQLSMHSVFDVTDCLEGLKLITTIRSLHVILQQSSSRGPSEVHWAIKEGSVLARAVSLQHLQVECTSMLIKLLPPQLRSLHVTARKVNVQLNLRVALSMLDSCNLQAKHGVEYF